jgi:hypothetical protein
VTRFGFIDPRYGHCPEENRLMGRPAVLGTGRFTAQWSIEDVGNASIHPIIQSFDAGTAHPKVRWPTGLSIWVNGELIKPPQMRLNWPLVDLAQFQAPLSLHIESDHVTPDCHFVLRYAAFCDMNGLLDLLLMKARLPEGAADQVAPTNICPITGRRIGIPGKGEKCRHAQCFDVEAFLERSLLTNMWFCPVCGAYIGWEGLMAAKGEFRQGPPPQEVQVFQDLQFTVDPEEFGVAWEPEGELDSTEWG